MLNNCLCKYVTIVLQHFLFHCSNDFSLSFVANQNLFLASHTIDYNDKHCKPHYSTRNRITKENENVQTHTYDFVAMQCKPNINISVFSKYKF